MELFNNNYEFSRVFPEKRKSIFSYFSYSLRNCAPLKNYKHSDFVPTSTLCTHVVPCYAESDMSIWVCVARFW